jgi:hypothetical protein
MSLRTTVRECINDLDNNGEGAIERTIANLKAAGAVKNAHVGKKGFTPDETVEWYAGQILDILESGSLFAVNSLINCVDKFAPEQ